MQLGRDHLRVVDDQRIAGPQQIRQVADMPVLEPTAGLHDKHAR
jgi:hypothetical protein